MIRRPLLVAAAFLLSALVIFAALQRITAMALALEKSEAAALQRATHEENVRIALWRMDASLAELIAVENTRSAARFAVAGETSGLSPATAMARDPGAGGGPDLASLVRARFEIGPEQRPPVLAAVAAPHWLAHLALPAQPPPSRRPAARRPRPSPPSLGTELATVAPPDRAATDNAPEAPDSLGTGTPRNDTGDAATARPANDSLYVLQNTAPVLVDRMNVGGNERGQQSAYTQEALNTQAFKRRQELGQQSSLVQPADAPPGVDVESAFAADWVEDKLVLKRQVRRGDARLLQLTWLDWPALRARLLAEVAAVAPAARLEPLGAEPDPGRTLALLPVRLVPGPMPETAPQDSTPVRLSLAAAWLAALVGLVGVGALLMGSVTLSQRRADFVSAVTHELRTPLTTLRLYSDMLLDGMVRAEDRPAHIATLKREADRLGHLVENVLAFSRLEQHADRARPAAARVEMVPLAALLARIAPDLTERAARGGLALDIVDIAAPKAADSTRVMVDVPTAEQILLNLVDNACKYACNPERPELHLETAVRGRHVILRLRDHGGGIGARDRKRLFRPFHRSAAQAAGSAPGVGLGLALGRRLARGMGGDLRLVNSAQGACFELWLLRAEDADSPAVATGPS